MPPCPRCQAHAVLTADDWLVVGFYRRVASCYRNQSPMGTGKGKAPILTPVLSDYRAALDLYGYERWLWAWLTDNAVTVHRLVHKIDDATRDVCEATGKAWRAVTPEDVSDGYES